MKVWAPAHCFGRDKKEHFMKAQSLPNKWDKPIVIIILATIAVFTGLLFGTPPAIADADGCTSTCVSAPQRGDFVNVDSQQLFGFTEDLGRVEFVIDFSSQRGTVVQLGHVVQGQWVPYVVEVTYATQSFPNQALAFLVGGKRQLVSITTRDVKPGERIEARAWWATNFFLSFDRQEYYSLASARLEDIPSSGR